MKAVIALRDGGQQQVDAQRSKAPGLIIHRSIPPTFYEWEVTHQASGFTVASFERLSSARRFAERVAGLADWTLPSDQLNHATVDVTRIHEIRDQIRKAEWS